MLVLLTVAVYSNRACSQHPHNAIFLEIPVALSQILRFSLADFSQKMLHRGNVINLVRGGMDCGPKSFVKPVTS